MTTETSELNPVHVPRFLMTLIGIGYAVWLVIVPLVYVLRMGRTDYLFLPACGLLLIPFAIMSLFVRRLVLYFYYRFFWYLTALAALLSLACGGVVTATLLISPSTFSSITLPNNPETLPLPVASLNQFTVVVFTVGVIGLIIFLSVMMRRTSAKPSKAIPKEVSAAAERDLRSQLAERSKRLGK